MPSYCMSHNALSAMGNTRFALTTKLLPTYMLAPYAANTGAVLLCHVKRKFPKTRSPWSKQANKTGAQKSKLMTTSCIGGVFFVCLDLCVVLLISFFWEISVSKSTTDTYKNSNSNNVRFRRQKKKEAVLALAFSWSLRNPVLGVIDVYRGRRRHNRYVR